MGTAMNLTSSRQFFEQQLPTMLKAAPPADLKGVVEFTIEGDGGAVWWVDFAQKTVTKAGAKAPKFAALVRAQERDFLALVEGRMSPADGLLTRRLHLAGEAVAIAKLTAAIGQMAARAS